MKQVMTMTSTPFRWYRLTGTACGDANTDTSGTVFVHYVEAASRHNAVKHYGGKRIFFNAEGKKVVVQFPTREQQVETLPVHWSPSSLTQAPSETGLVVKVTPAVRYRCSHCGKVRFSEHRYPSMWCNCSHKAFPDPPDGQWVEKG
jgi:hypothetical protein